MLEKSSMTLARQVSVNPFKPMKYFTQREIDMYQGAVSLNKMREFLLKGKAWYSWPPCTNWFGAAAFDNANIIYFLQNKLP